MGVGDLIKKQNKQKKQWGAGCRSLESCQQLHSLTQADYKLQVAGAEFQTHTQKKKKIKTKDQDVDRHSHSSDLEGQGLETNVSIIHFRHTHRQTFIHIHTQRSHVHSSVHSVSGRSYMGETGNSGMRSSPVGTDGTKVTHANYFMYVCVCVCASMCRIEFLNSCSMSLGDRIASKQPTCGTGSLLLSQWPPADGASAPHWSPA